jgi:hypothetical protein
VIIALAMAGTDIRSGAGGPRMDTRANPVMINPAACTNRRDMRAGVHAMVADTGASTHHRSGMAAGADAMRTDIATGAHIADMGARTHAMTVDVRTNTHAQHINAEINGVGAWRKQSQGTKCGGGKIFHVAHPFLIG